MSHRGIRDDVDTNQPYAEIAGEAKTLRQTGIFIHDDWTLVPERLKLGIGGRLDRATANGTQTSLNAKPAVDAHPGRLGLDQSSRSPRISSRGERDISLLTGVSLIQVPGQPGVNIPVINQVTNNSDPRPREMKGVEFGYRKQLAANLGADLSAYHQRYTDLRGAALLGMYGCHPMFAGLGITFDPASCAHFGLPAGSLVLFNQSRTANNLAGTSRGVNWRSTGW
ncbi:MAG: TonB-dependent receptor [Microthrixaceae bacterium]